MTDTILTDDEALVAFARQAPGILTHYQKLSIVRSIETAILAKLKGAKCSDLTPETAVEEWVAANPISTIPASLYLRDFADRVLARFGNCVKRNDWEVEARERERKAWDAAMILQKDVLMGMCYTPNTSVDAERDRLYPSLAPKEDDGVTLSNGGRYRRLGGSWEMWLQRAKQWVRTSSGNISIHTAADAEKITAYLKTQEAL